MKKVQSLVHVFYHFDMTKKHLLIKNSLEWNKNGTKNKAQLHIDTATCINQISNHVKGFPGLKTENSIQVFYSLVYQCYTTFRFIKMTEVI